MKTILLAVSWLAFAACSQDPSEPDVSDAVGAEEPMAAAKTVVVLDLDAQAKRIAMENIIVDGHIDVPYRLADGWQNVAESTQEGDFDYPRAVAGGLSTPFMSIYTPAKFDGTEEATQHAERMIGIVERIAAESPTKFRLVKSVAEVEQAFADGVIGLPLGMENGSPINGDLGKVNHFYERGIRYITLTHSKANHISDSSYDETRRWNGLSEFGVQVVERMNQVGIMIDISHVSDEAFWDALKASKVPMIASHSSARHFVPGFERNMDDEMIKALGAAGGVIMINFGSSFVTDAAHQYGPKLDAAYQTYLSEQSLEDSNEREEKFEKEYKETTPYPFAGVSDILDHIDHVVKIAGIDSVGLGSDYDGVGDSLPTGLKDVAGYPNLVKGMLERGHSEADIQKVLSGNALRVWRATEAYAAEHSSR